MKDSSKKKVLVIGGSGFIGSHVADLLSDSGFNVVIYDSKESNWIRNDQEMLIGSILNKEDLNNAINGSYYVYHFAGIADIGESRSNPYDTINLNVMGTTNVAEACIKFGVKRLIYASTMYVYSNKGSFYSASKKACEGIIETFNNEFGMNYTFLRYGSLYGPRAQEWNGVRSYVSQAIKDKKIKFNGSGNEIREYIHVLDAARLSVKILEEKYIDTSINVTGQQVLKAKEFLDLIFEILGYEKNIEFDNLHNHGHYISTPYKYQQKTSKKIVPDEFIDIGEGILTLIKDIES